MYYQLETNILPIKTEKQIHLFYIPIDQSRRDDSIIEKINFSLAGLNPERVI